MYKIAGYYDVFKAASDLELFTIPEIEERIGKKVSSIRHRVKQLESNNVIKKIGKDGKSHIYKCTTKPGNHDLPFMALGALKEISGELHTETIITVNGIPKFKAVPIFDGE